MSEFMELYRETEQRMEDEKVAWLKDLYMRGIVAAHPDDGWVDRSTNEVFLCYPYFDYGITEGAVIALGRPWKYRLVKITGSRKSIMGQTYWQFKELEKYVEQIGDND